MNLPKEVQDIVEQQEKVDFVTKSDRYESKYNGVVLILISIVGGLGNFYVFFYAWEKYISGFEKMERFYSGVSMILIAILIGLYGIWRISRKGGYFIGTPKKIIRYDGNRTDMYWKDFKNIVDMKGKLNNGRILMLNEKLAKDTYSSTTMSHKGLVYIGGIENYHEIGEKCQQRIQENINN